MDAWDELQEQLRLLDNDATDTSYELERLYREAAKPRPYSLPLSVFEDTLRGVAASKTNEEKTRNAHIFADRTPPNDNVELSDTVTIQYQLPFFNGTHPHIAPPPSPIPPPAYRTPPRPNTPVTPLTDLANGDLTTTAPTLDLSSLQTSRHHPDFRIRNQPRFLRLSTILSDLQLHLSTAYKTQDQAAFNDLHARIAKGGEGLSTLAQAMPPETADVAARKLNGAEMSEVVRCMKASEWYRAEHGKSVEEGEEHDILSLERIERATEVYEASLGKDSSGADGSDSEVEDDGEWEDESDETIWVEDVEGRALSHPSISLALE